jgi:hypothetical protein
MRRSGTLLLASLAIIPGTALFIGLLTGSLRQQRLTLEWPHLIDSSGYAISELLIAAVPGMLAFLLAGAFLRHKALLVVAFICCALLACTFAAALFAQAFGNTWSTREIILELVIAHLHLVALALLPGTLLITLLGQQRALSR